MNEFFLFFCYADALIVRDLHWKALRHYVFLQQSLIKNLNSDSNYIFSVSKLQCSTHLLCGALMSTQVALSQIIRSRFALTSDVIFFNHFLFYYKLKSNRLAKNPKFTKARVFRFCSEGCSSTLMHDFFTLCWFYLHREVVCDIKLK